MGIIPYVPFAHGCRADLDLDMDTNAIRRFQDYIEIGLPEEPDRLVYLKKLLGANALKENEFHQLMQESEGCSFNEIKTMIGQLRRETFVNALQSEYFKEDPAGKIYTACNGSDIGAQRLSIEKLPKDTLRTSVPKFDKLLARFENPIKGTTQKDISDIVKFRTRYMNPDEKN